MNFLGLSNQNMSARPEVARSRQYFTCQNPGDTSWTCPATGYYTFTLRGGGGFSGSSGGGSGAAAQVTALIFSGQVTTFTIGGGADPSGSSPNGGNTVLTLPSGHIVTAGGASAAAAGAATGGDINIAGSPGPGSTPNPGASAPAIGRFPAVPATGASSRLTPGPGAGGSLTGGGPINAPAGAGVLYIQGGKV